MEIIGVVLGIAFLACFAYGLVHWLAGTPDEGEDDDPIDGRGMF